MGQGRHIGRQRWLALAVPLILAVGAGGVASAQEASPSQVPAASTSAVTPPPGESSIPTGSGAIESVAPSLSAAIGAWTAGPPFAQASSLKNLSCASPTFCLMEGMAWDGTTWSTMAPLSTGTSVEIVTCVAETTCLGISGDNFVMWDGKQWSVGRNFYATGGDQGGVSINDLACVSEKLCFALDMTYGQVFAWNGKSWSKPVTVDKAVADNVAAINAGTTDNLVSPSIACGSPTLCVVVDSANNVTSWDGTTWAPLSVVGTPTTRQLPKPPVACSATWCVAGVNGGVTVFDGTNWSAPAGIPVPTYPGGPPVAFETIACPSDGSCVAIGARTMTSDWATFDGQQWQLGTAPVGIQEPGPIACPTANWCMDVGPYSYATLQR